MSKSDEQIERESTRRIESQKKKAGFTPRSNGGGIADWTSVDGGLVVRAVAAIGRGGGALRLGYTRDGGAYAIGLYDGDERQTIYVSPNDDIEGTLREVAEYYEK